MRKKGASVSAREVSSFSVLITHPPHAVPSLPPARRPLTALRLYQCAYTEIVVLDGLWPDFGTAELAGALREFGRRRRTFGRRDEGGDRGDG